MQIYKLIARKQVIIDIAKGKQTTEERDWTDYYKKRFKDIQTPCKLWLRIGYNKDALYVEVIAKSHRIHDYHNSWLDRLLRTVDQNIIFELGKVLDTNIDF